MIETCKISEFHKTVFRGLKCRIFSRRQVYLSVLLHAFKFPAAVDYSPIETNVTMMMLSICTSLNYPFLR